MPSLPLETASVFVTPSLIRNELRLTQASRLTMTQLCFQAPKVGVSCVVPQLLINERRCSSVGRAIDS